jgi:hypothetical protein
LMKQLAHHVMALPFMVGSKFKQNQERWWNCVGIVRHFLVLGGY